MIIKQIIDQFVAIIIITNQQSDILERIAIVLQFLQLAYQIFFCELFPSNLVPIFVLIPFKKYEEENGSILLKQDKVRILFDKKCGENDVTVASIVETDPPVNIDVMQGRSVFPHHNLITFHLSGDNATCDWSYSVELELEDATGGGASLAASASLAVALAAALFL